MAITARRIRELHGFVYSQVEAATHRADLAGEYTAEDLVYLDNMTDLGTLLGQIVEKVEDRESAQREALAVVERRKADGGRRPARN